MKQRKAWQGILTAAALTAMTVAGGCNSGVSDEDIEFSSLADIRNKQASLKENDRAILLIDSRSPAAYRERHIKGAINYTLAQAPTSKTVQDTRLLGYDTIIVYGNNRGDASAKGLTKRLLELDYDDVYWFANGMDEWVAAGGETEGVMAKP